MNADLLIALALCSVLSAAGCGLLMVQRMRQEQRLQQRMRAVRGEAAPRGARAAEPPVPLPVRLVAMAGGAIMRSGLLSAGTLAELEQTLVSSGLRGRNGLGLFIGCKILLFLLAPLVAFVALGAAPVSPMLHRALPAAAAVFGLLAPDMIVRRNRRRYLQRVESGVADALDLMVICAQGGLGLEPALNRVAGEIVHAHPAMAQEMAQTAREMQIAVDSRAALAALGTRTGLESLKRVTTTLVQTIQYGTPVSEALRSLAAEMRQEMLTRYEERAARLPVLLTVPMIVFILPCLFVVIGGPAALHIMKAFGH